MCLSYSITEQWTRIIAEACILVSMGVFETPCSRTVVDRVHQISLDDTMMRTCFGLIIAEYCVAEIVESTLAGQVGIDLGIFHLAPRVVDFDP